MKNLPAKRDKTEIFIKCDECGYYWWQPVNFLPAACPACENGQQYNRTSKSWEAVLEELRNPTQNV